MGVLFAGLMSLARSAPLTFIVSPWLHSKTSAASATPVHVRLMRSALVAAGRSEDSAPLAVPSSNVFPSAGALLGSSALRSPVDFILLTCKAHTSALRSAIAESRALLGHSPDAVVLPMVNGILHLSMLPELLPAASVVYASTALGAHWSSASTLTQGGDGPTTFILPHSPPPSVGLLRGLLSSVPFVSRWADERELHGVLWSKLVANCVVNPFTAVHDVTNGEVAKAYEERAEVRALVEGVVREVVGVGHARRVRFVFEERGMAEEDVVSAAVAHVLRVVKDTAGNVSSMLSDVRGGRQTEVDAMNGEIVRLGKAAHIETPFNRALVQSVRDKSAAAAPNSCDLVKSTAGRPP